MGKPRNGCGRLGLLAMMLACGAAMAPQHGWAKPAAARAETPGARDADRVAIIDLLGRYAWYVNSQDSEGFASCFTEDGVWEGAGFGRIQGVEALRTMWGKRTPRNPHLPLNYVVEVDGDTASAHSDILIVSLKDGQWSISTVGAYDDKLVRVGGSWKIKYRKFSRLGVPAAEM